MKKNLILVGGGTLYGMLLDICGHPFSTWQFYALMIPAAAWAIIAYHLGEKSDGAG